MSALVDIWTSEMSKLREKNQKNNYSATAQNEESNQSFQEKDNKTSTAKLMQFNKPRFQLSEATLSMLLECFNA